MNDQPIREIKPVVVPAQFFVRGMFVAALLALVPAGLVGIFVDMATVLRGSYDEPTIRQWGLVFASGGATYALAFTVIMFFFGIAVFKEPGRTSYTVFPDHIECRQGFWIRSRRTLPFDQVVAVELTEGPLQRTRGAGTVTLVLRKTGGTAAGQEEPEDATSRVAFDNVPHPGEVYDLIRSLVSKKTEAEPGAAADRAASR